MTDNINEYEQSDTRRLAAERLREVAVLQFRRQRSRRPGGEPWRDPRGGQGCILAVLKLKPEMTQRELTYLMGMSRQSMAELLRKLETQGLVTREPSPNDRRTVTVTLTDTGRDAAQDDSAESTSRLAFIDCLSDDEVANFADYLGRIIEQLEQESGDDFQARREMIREFRQHHGRGPRGPFPGFAPGDFPFGPGGFPFGPDPWSEAGFDPEEDDDFRPGPRGHHGHHPPHGPRGGRPMTPPASDSPQDRHAADDPDDLGSQDPRED